MHERLEMALMPKLSIIIPVYNVEKYVVQCIDSILKQHEQDVEIILIDDGSTDGSGKICDEYYDRYNNVVVVHQQNKGLGISRNVGLETAKGKFIWYLDSDDYTTADSIGVIKRNLQEEIDILLFCAESFSDGADATAQYKRTKNLDVVLPGKEMLKRSISDGEYITSVCLRIYRRAFLLESGIAFGGERLFEDEQYAFLTMYQAKRVKTIGNKLYMRRYHQGSKMVDAKQHNAENFSGYMDGYGKAIKTLLEYCNAKVIDLEDKKLFFYQISILYIAIVSKYSLLDWIGMKENHESIKQLKKELYPYRLLLTDKARKVISMPRIYVIFRRIRALKG